MWKVEARLYRSNFKHKTRLPVEMIRAYAEQRFREGVDVLLLGHFHRSWTERVGTATVLDVEAREPATKHSISLQQVERW